MEKDFNSIKLKWQIPLYKSIYKKKRISDFCVVIPVINEGNRICELLQRMKKIHVSKYADIIIIDGGSDDGSIAIDKFKKLDVLVLLQILSSGKLSSQLRCAYSFSLEHGYSGIVTIDGNNKDNPNTIEYIIDLLKKGYDFVQASRYIEGGVGLNIPRARDLAIRYIHAPILSKASGFKWTDTTQGFRGYSRKMLLDPEISPFREIFVSYELLAYLSYRTPKLGYKCIEVPSTREYPKKITPTKISFFKGNLTILSILKKVIFGFYNP